MVLFEMIGVNTTGFYDAHDDRFWTPSPDASDARGLGLCAKGAFDGLLQEYLPASFLGDKPT